MRILFLTLLGGIFFTQIAGARDRLELVGEPTGHHPDSSVVNLIFSADGKTLYSADDLGTVRVWDIASGTGKVLMRFKDGEVWDFDLSPDGKELGLAVVEEARSLVVRADAATGKISGSVSVKDAILGSARFHPGGKVLASDGREGGLRFWRLSDFPTTESVDEKNVKSLDAAMDVPGRGQVRVVNLEFSPDKKLAITSSSEPIVRVWSLPRCEPLATLKNPGGTKLNRISISSSGTGRLVASGPQDTFVWELPKGSVISHYRNSVERNVGVAAISPDGERVVSSYVAGQVRPDGIVLGKGLLLWDVPLGDAPVFEIEEAHAGDTVELVRISPDNKMVATTAAAGIRLWKIVPAE